MSNLGGNSLVPKPPSKKGNVISSIANLVYEFPHELQNNSRPRILGNKEILGKCQIWLETASCPVSLPKIKLWQ